MMNTQDVRGPDILLAIEVADSSLAKDLNLKAGVYARYGVRELWVIDVNRLVTHVFREPADGTWGVTAVLEADATLTHASAPGFSARLSAIQAARCAYPNLAFSSSSNLSAASATIVPGGKIATAPASRRA